MLAIRIHQFGPPDVLKLEEVPTLQPGPGQLLIRIHAIGVNPVDTYIRGGGYAHPPRLPYTPGMDAAGIVEAIGPGTRTGLKVGDRVYIARSITGTYAEFCLCEPHQAHPLPARISFPQGAGVFVPYATAYRSLFQRARAKSGEWVLVHGASGGVGTAALQLARAAGLRTIGTAGSPEGLDLIRREGAQHTLNHREPGYLDRIREITGYPAGGVDVVLEMLANENLEKSLGLLAMNGRIVIIGSHGPVEITPRQTMSRDSSIIGMSLHNAGPAELADLHAAIHTGLESGALTPVVGREMPLAEAARAHDLIMQPGARGKIVLLP
ncbi:MAG: NADPH:quinone reductase [Phycisphaerales bacterium]|nr:NADPH:quinone reductase [Phycisphaerales bacterium]